MAAETPRGNIYDYVCESNESFAEKPPTDVDLLCLSAIAYFSLEHAIDEAGSSSQTWGELCPFALNEFAPGGRLNALGDIGVLTADDGYVAAAAEFLPAVAQSRRFGPVIIERFACEYGFDPCIQFAAMTLDLGGAGKVVAFRGTDVSAIGWYDSIQMICFAQTPTTTRAIQFLQEVAETMEDGQPLYVCGHSKGGTLAENAVLMGNDDMRQQVTRCVSFDGVSPFTNGGALNPDLEERDQDMLSCYDACDNIVRYAFRSLMAPALERREDAQIAFVDSVDGKARHCVYHAKVQNGKFATFVPSAEELKEASACGFYAQLNREERRLLCDVFAECCYRTGYRADFSFAFVKLLAKEFEDIVHEMDEQQLQIGEHISAVYAQYWP